MSTHADCFDNALRHTEAYKQARTEILDALNNGDDSCSYDPDGAVFYAGYGEYGTRILSGEQVDNLVRLLLTSPT
jgi:hypothetical protein